MFSVKVGCLISDPSVLTPQPCNDPGSLVHSHWSRNVEAWLSLVESFIVLLRQLYYAIKNLYGIRDRWLPCTERSYYRRPYAIKNQRRASKDPSRGLCVPKPLVGGFGCDELVLYGIRVLVEQFLGKVLDIEMDHTA